MGAPQLPSTAMCKNCNTRRPAMYTMVLEHQAACMTMDFTPGVMAQDSSSSKADGVDKAVSKPKKKSPGDWDCPKCGNTNFAQSFMCRCGYLRPQSALPKTEKK